MDISTKISLVSLIVAIAALPFSYYVAVKQVKTEFNERDIRDEQRARSIVADRLDEFLNLFYFAVKRFTGIEPNEIEKHREEVNSKIQEIDFFIEKTQVFNRLAGAIDNLLMTNFPHSSEQNILYKIQSIRNLIELGSDKTQYVSLGIIKCCEVNYLQFELRKK